MQNEITSIAFASYKKKSTPVVSAPPWWMYEIKTARNKVRAHRRKLQKQQDENLRVQKHTLFKKERAKLKKKLINKTKSKT